MSSKVTSYFVSIFIFISLVSFQNCVDSQHTQVTEGELASTDEEAAGEVVLIAGNEFESFLNTMEGYGCVGCHAAELASADAVVTAGWVEGATFEETTLYQQVFNCEMPPTPQTNGEPCVGLGPELEVVEAFVNSLL